MEKKRNWDFALTTGVMIVFVYGIWSTRYMVGVLDEKGTHVSRMNSEAIYDLKTGQSAMIESLEIIKQNNEYLKSNHDILVKLLEEKTSK